MPGGEVHVGDDAAVLNPFVGQAIISTDFTILGVHLEPDLFPLEDLGFKAVASAVSDLAAMGARPRGATVAVCPPPGNDLEELHRGIARAASTTGCPIVGGDLSRSRDIAVAVTVFGECPGRGAVLRSGAERARVLADLLGALSPSEQGAVLAALPALETLVDAWKDRDGSPVPPARRSGDARAGTGR